MKVTGKTRAGIILFLFPTIFLFAAFFIYPIIDLSANSFTKAGEFSGLANYAKVLGDPIFQRAIGNNIVWALTASLIQVPLAMFVAILLSYKMRGWKFFRTVYFLPQVISGVALATMWAAVYNAEYGLLNGILRSVGLESLTRNWLGTLETAFASILIYWVFYVGYYMVIMLADIQSIPEDIFEAAAIDGAGKLRTAFRVTIPLIRESLVMCMTLAAIFGLRQFEQVYLLTNGGPANRTMVMVLYLYNEMQKFEYNTSSAAAILLIILGVIVIVGLRLTAGRENK